MALNIHRVPGNRKGEFYRVIKRCTIRTDRDTTPHVVHKESRWHFMLSCKTLRNYRVYLFICMPDSLTTHAPIYSCIYQSVCLST